MPSLKSLQDSWSIRDPEPATGTMVHALLFHFQNLSDVGGDSPARHCPPAGQMDLGPVDCRQEQRRACAAQQGLSGSADSKRLIWRWFMEDFDRSPATIELSIGRHPTDSNANGRADDGADESAQTRIPESVKAFPWFLAARGADQDRPNASDSRAPERHRSSGRRRRRLRRTPATGSSSKKYGDPGRYFLHAARLRSPIRRPVWLWNSTLHCRRNCRNCLNAHKIYRNLAGRRVIAAGSAGEESPNSTGQCAS